MGVGDFLGQILPPEGSGWYVLAVFRNGLKSPPHHKFYRSVDELGRAAVSYDADGINVYHACASYRTNENRKGDNTQAFRSSWVDLDVKDGQYGSPQEAAADIFRFAKEVGLPAPTVVFSGKGLHCYWPYTVAIGAPTWDKIAAVFRAALDRCGVKHDPSRTTDKASVLRPVGTHRYKDGEPKEVRVLKPGEPIDPQAFGLTLKSYCDKLGVVLTPPASAGLNSALSAGLNYEFPPASAVTASSQCAAMAAVRDSKGDGQFGHWRSVIGVIKFCTEGKALAAEWSSQRAVAHDRNDWEYQYESWNAGPTTCAEMEKHTPALCEKCVHRGKIKSPIQLGVLEVAPSVPITIGDTQQEVVLPDGYRWTGKAMEKSIKVPAADGSTSTVWTPFSSVLVLVKDRVRGIDGTWSAQCSVQTKPGRPPSEFTVPGWELNDARSLMKTIGKYEIHPYGKAGPMHMKDFMTQCYLECLEDDARQRRVYPHMGWQTKDDVRRGPMERSFVLGDTLLTRKQPPKKTIVQVPPRFKNGLESSGTLNGWIEQVDFIYNRPGAQAHQFIICCGFASVLVRMMQDGGFHGIPVVLHGNTSGGKSTTARVALSIYGNPQHLMMEAQAKNGSTVTAIQATHGALNSLPFLIDEFTGHPADAWSMLFYGLANGEPRERGTATGELAESHRFWDGISFLTSNDDPMEKLRQLDSQKTADAGKYRALQVYISKEEVDRVFAGVNFEEAGILNLLNKHYGVVGQHFVQHLLDNFDQVVADLHSMKATYKITGSRYDSQQRFYNNLAIVVLVAGRIANQLGLLRFDMFAIERWLERIVLDNSKELGNWHDTFAEFVSSLYGRTIITSRYRGAGFVPGQKQGTEIPRVVPYGTTQAVARQATDDRVFIVTVNYFNEWCRNHGLAADDMRNHMRAAGWISPDASGNFTPVMSIGVNTGITTGKSRCYQLDYALASGALGVDEDNVVLLPTRNEDELPQHASVQS